MTKICAGVEKQESDHIISDKRKAMFPWPTWIAWTERRCCMRCDSVPTRWSMRFFCTWDPVDGINFESLNYPRLKWNPNILLPWVN